MKRIKKIAIITFIYLIGIMCIFVMSARAEQIDNQSKIVERGN